MTFLRGDEAMEGNINELSTVLDGFRRTHLLVVGDLMLDRFIWGDVERISPEAPVPVLRVISESSRLGGAANVMHNLRTLGGRVTACGIVGHDVVGDRLLRGLREIGVSTSGVFREKAFQTIQKTRIIARPRHQQIVRLDRENHGEVKKSTMKKIREFVIRNASKTDGIVVSDYGKGVIHRELLFALSGLLAKKKILCVIDPKKENFNDYRNATLVTPNKEEASQAAGIDIRSDGSLLAAGRKILRKWHAQGVLITRGPDGMSLFRPRNVVRHFPTEPRDIFDVTGAGDTVVAASALSLAGGSTFEEAAIIANLAARLVGDEVGTVAVPLEKLRKVIEDKK